MGSSIRARCRVGVARRGIADRGATTALRRPSLLTAAAQRRALSSVARGRRHRTRSGSPAAEGRNHREQDVAQPSHAARVPASELKSFSTSSSNSDPCSSATSRTRPPRSTKVSNTTRTSDSAVESALNVPAPLGAWAARYSPRRSPATGARRRCRSRLRARGRRWPRRRPRFRPSRPRGTSRRRGRGARPLTGRKTARAGRR